MTTKTLLLTPLKEVMIMNRQEFMGTLRSELSKLPPEEIADATEFYEEYFDEVLENTDTEGLTEEEANAKRAKAEAELIQEIGSPKTIAKQIKAEYASKLLEGNTESGKTPSVGHKLSAVWWIIIGICSAPVSIPVAIGIVCLACGILTGLVGLIFGIFAMIAGLFVASVSSFAVGISSLSISIPAGAMFMGFGLMGLALAAAGLVGAILIIKEIVLALARYFTKLNEKRKMKKLEKMSRGGETA